MKLNSIRFKATVFYSSVLIIILAFFSIYLLGTIRHILYSEVKQDLKVKAREIDAFIDAYASISPSANNGAFLINQYLSANDEKATRRWIIDHLWAQDSKSLGLRNDYFRILGPSGRPRLVSNNMTYEIEKRFMAGFPMRPDAVFFTNLKFNNTYYYGISYPFMFSDRTAFILQLATPVDFVHRVLSKLVFFMEFGIVAIFFMTVFMGSFLARRILKPVSDVSMVANNISQTNLHLRIPEQRLDHEMEELTMSFNSMIERLEKSFEHINEFSSHVAHELKTPLAVIKGELELALIEDREKEENKRVMKVALGEIDRLIRTVKDMLLLAKLEYKLNIFKMDELELTGFLRDIFEHSKLLAADKDIAVEITLPGHPVLVRGDQTHLRRIFFNLIQNAVSFTPKGGKIHIFVKIHGKQVNIAVMDNGIGIAPEHQPHIFEKFYRIRNKAHEDASGSGLGLCMARAVARSHGGDITFESHPGVGSTFNVTLPHS